MESSVHSHCGNSCRHRPLSWELPLPVSSCTPQQFMFGDTKNCLYFITDFTYSLAARSVLWRLQDCEFLVVSCSYCSYIIFPESPKLHYWERRDLVAGPLKEGTLVTVTNRIFFRSLQRVWRAEAVFNINTYSFSDVCWVSKALKFSNPWAQGDHPNAVSLIVSSSPLMPVSDNIQVLTISRKYFLHQ